MALRVFVFKVVLFCLDLNEFAISHGPDHLFSLQERLLSGGHADFLNEWLELYSHGPTEYCICVTWQATKHSLAIDEVQRGQMSVKSLRRPTGATRVAGSGRGAGGSTDEGSRYGVRRAGLHCLMPLNYATSTIGKTCLCNFSGVLLCGWFWDVLVFPG